MSLHLKYSFGVTGVDFIHDLLKLDAKVFKQELQGSFESVSGRYLANPNSFLLVYDGDKIVGYLCLLTVTEALHNRILSSDIIVDDDIKGSDILEISNYGYLFSVVVDKEYRDGRAVKLLYSHFNNLCEINGITHLTATAVSQDGEKFLTNLNFEKVRCLADSYVLFQRKG